MAPNVENELSEHSHVFLRKNLCGLSQEKKHEIKHQVQVKSRNQGGNNEKFGMFRLLIERTVRKSKKNDGTSITVKGCESEEEGLQIEPEEDPVIILLESRNKQRVRFCLEGQNDEVTGREATEITEKKSDSITNKTTESGNSFNIKNFMRRILYKNAVNIKHNGEITASDKNDEDNTSNEIVWESHSDENTETGSPEVIRTTISRNKGLVEVSFREDPLLRAKIIKLLEKAQRAQLSHYRYRYALKCYIKVHELLSDAKYPENHQLLVKALRLLNNPHHVLSCSTNSANIVKMGMKYEEAGDLVKALKMYTIAYRIRRDQISCTHPSLLVLLNILGSIQTKRGELQEAMQIYELALKDSPILVTNYKGDIPPRSPSSNLLGRAVTFREMGIIQEKWNNPKRALKMYHRSLGCISKWREKIGDDGIPEVINIQSSFSGETATNGKTLPNSIDNLQLVKSLPIEFSLRGDLRCCV